MVSKQPLWILYCVFIFVTAYSGEANPWNVKALTFICIYEGVSSCLTERQFYNLKNKQSRLQSAWHFPADHRTDRHMAPKGLIAVGQVGNLQYYARLQTAVARGLGLPASHLLRQHTDAAPKHSLCYFNSGGIFSCCDARILSKFEAAAMRMCKQQPGMRRLRAQARAGTSGLPTAQNWSISSYLT